MKKLRNIITMICAGILLFSYSNVAYAKTVQLADGTVFDSDFYANTYPDLLNAFGYDYDLLLNHYLTYGVKEGRISSDGTTAPEAVVAITPSVLTPIGSLANRASLKKKCTDAEFQAAYDAAAQIVTPLVGLSMEDQLSGIASALRSMFDSGQVTYSTSAAHYNDPYGYFVVGTASCAGCTRATGLCLNMLGITYEHVNENKWRHQWCRININRTYWICDAYGLYVGPEPAPYVHPYLN